MLVIEINKAHGTFKVCELDEKGNGKILGNGTMSSGNFATDSDKDSFITAVQKGISTAKVVIE